MLFENPGPESGLLAAEALLAEGVALRVAAAFFIRIEDRPGQAAAFLGAARSGSR